MLVSEEMKSDQSHPGGGQGRTPPRLGKAEDKGYGLPLRATLRTIPYNRISIKKDQDKGRSGSI